MTKDDRVNLEKRMTTAFEKLIANPAYGGTYFSLTPETKYSISQTKYQPRGPRGTVSRSAWGDPQTTDATREQGKFLLMRPTLSLG
eukprot:7768520-Pyramimonas_sp.AAC.1